MTADVVRAVVADHRDHRGPLLPILHAIQARLGYVPQEAIAVLAAELNLSRADVHGVVTFYHDFRQEPAPELVVRVCRAEACQALGADRLVSMPDAAVEQVFCLGNCALGPSVQVNGRLYGRVDEVRLRSIIDEAVS